MRLFLASQDLGNYAEVLRQLVGAKCRALAVSNAGDYYQDEAKITERVQQTIDNLSAIGVTAERLDLKPYFGKQAELADFIEQKQVGLIFSTGGNSICLSTAMHESGLDEIIRKGATADKFVYGGYSAGAIVATHDLSLYEVKSRTSASIARNVYSFEPHLRGLGLISQYVIPHVNRADQSDTMHERLAKIEQAGAEAICLNDADVLVVDGDKMEVMRG